MCGRPKRGSCLGVACNRQFETAAVPDDHQSRWRSADLFLSPNRLPGLSGSIGVSGPGEEVTLTGQGIKLGDALSVKAVEGQTWKLSDVAGNNRTPQIRAVIAGNVLVDY